MTPWATTSRAKGIHVYVPVTGLTYGDTKSYARALAARLARERPNLEVDRTARSARAGKVLVDWSQNDPGKSMVAPYSLRALRAPTVATPVTWNEVERREDLFFTPADVLARLSRAS